jgi:hypothetical protein
MLQAVRDQGLQQKFIGDFLYRLMPDEEIDWLREIRQDLMPPGCFAVPIHIVRLEDGLWIRDNGFH